MSTKVSTKPKATIEDLYHVPEHGKAELINGEVVRFMPTGGIPSRASGQIYLSLSLYERERGGGYAVADNAGVTEVEFLVDGVSVGIDTQPPFAVAWAGGATGARTLTVRARDLAGNEGEVVVPFAASAGLVGDGGGGGRCALLGVEALALFLMVRAFGRGRA